MSEVGEGMKRPAGDAGAGNDDEERREGEGECRTENKGVTEECGEPAAKVARGEEPDEGTGDSFEREVGITEYTGPQVPGFRGILKDRYSDFLVNEVDMAGNVVHLTGIAMPEDAPTSPFSTAERRAVAAAAAAAAPATDTTKSVQEELAEIVGAEEAARFVAWHSAQEEQQQQQEGEKETKKDEKDGEGGGDGDTEKTEKKEEGSKGVEAVFRFGALKDKKGRGAVHALVKARLAGFCSGAEVGVVWVRR